MSDSNAIMPTPVAILIALAISAILLDVVGGAVAAELRADLTLVFFSARLMLDGAIVASLFLRRRFVWISLTSIYAFAVLWRSTILVPALLGLGSWPVSKWGTYLILGHTTIAATSVGLLCMRKVRSYFETSSTACVGD